MFSQLDETISLYDSYQSAIKWEICKCHQAGRLINIFFVHGKHVLVPYLHKPFNRMFTLGYFSDAWSMGEEIPLHKKGDKFNVNNYPDMRVWMEGLIFTIHQKFSPLIISLKFWAIH